MNEGLGALQRRALDEGGRTRLTLAELAAELGFDDLTTDDRVGIDRVLLDGGLIPDPPVTEAAPNEWVDLYHPDGDPRKRRLDAAVNPPPPGGVRPVRRPWQASLALGLPLAVGVLVVLVVLLVRALA